MDDHNMNLLHDMLFDQIRKELSFERIAAELIRRKLEDKGIILTERQLRQLRKRLAKDDIGEIKVKIPVRQVRQAGLDPKEFGQNFVLDLSDSDADIEEIYLKFNQVL
jgi:hypothetical protein